MCPAIVAPGSKSKSSENCSREYEDDRFANLILACSERAIKFQKSGTAAVDRQKHRQIVKARYDGTGGYVAGLMVQHGSRQLISNPPF